MSNSVDFWYLRISLRATIPGLHLIGFLTPPVLTLPRFFWAAWLAHRAFFLAWPGDKFFLTGFVEKPLRGVFPVFFRAVFFVFTMFCSLKYNESLGRGQLPDWVAISNVKSFPLGLSVPLDVEGCGSWEVEGSGSSNLLFFLTGDDSGVGCTLVLGVELNSEQFST